MASGDQGDGGARRTSGRSAAMRARRRRDVYRRRRIALALLAGAALVGGVAVGAGAGGGGSDSAAEAEASRPTLPGAGATCSPTIASSPSTAPRRATSSARSEWGPGRGRRAPARAGRAPTRGNRPGAAGVRADALGRRRRPGRRRRVRPARVRRGDPALPRRGAALRGLLLLDVQPGRADFATRSSGSSPTCGCPTSASRSTPSGTSARRGTGPGDRLGRRRHRQRDLRRPRRDRAASSTCPRSCS